MRFVVLAGMVAVLACGPIDQAGSGAGGGGADAGTSADAGTAAGGGSPDAGGGGVAFACAGVVPPDPGAPTTTVTVEHGGGDACFDATTDGSANVAAESHASSMGDAWTGRWQILGRFGRAARVRLLRRRRLLRTGGGLPVDTGRRARHLVGLRAGVAPLAARRQVQPPGVLLRDGRFAGAGSLRLPHRGSALRCRGKQAASTDDIADGTAAAGIVDAQGRA